MRISSVVMLVGGTLVVIGALVRFAPGAVSWFGNLPGDIRIENDNTTVLIPITSMIVVSVVMTLVFSLVRHILGDR